MAEPRFFLITTHSDREEALRRRLVEVQQTNFVGGFRIQDSPAQLDVLLPPSRPEVVLLDSAVPRDRALELALRVGDLVPRAAVVVLMADRDFDFLQATVKAGIDLALVEPVDLAALMKQASEVQRNKLRRLGAPPSASRAEPRPEPVVAPSSGGRVLAFLSSKDGEGKSTVALNLAVALTRQFGKRCVYLDLADTLSETGMMLDSKPPGTYLNLLATQAGNFSLDGVQRFAIDYFRDGKLLAICGNLGIVPPKVDSHALEGLLRFLRSESEFLILDCPVPVGENLKVALKTADLHVMVVQNTLSSLRNARIYLGELKRLEFPPHQVRVVLNRVSRTAGLAKDDLAKNLEYPVAASVVSNGAVALEAANVGVPVVVHAPESDLAISIQNLAKAFLGIESSDPSEAGKKGLASMFSSLFGR